MENLTRENRLYCNAEYKIITPPWDEKIFVEFGEEEKQEYGDDEDKDWYYPHQSLTSNEDSEGIDRQYYNE